MSYRNKTYVAFASEDINNYRLMQAWHKNANIEFSFFNAHDLFVARDTSKPESIKAQLRERLKNAKQFVLLGSPVARKKGGDGDTFLGYEINAMLRLNLPIVIANLDGGRSVQTKNIPQPILDADYYTMSVSFQPKIIKCALDDYAPNYAGSSNKGSYYYTADVYKTLGLE